MAEDEVDALLGRFAAKVTDPYELVDTDLQRGVVVVRCGTTVHSLHVDRDELARALADDDPGFWGPGVDRVESVARFMAVHLDESLGTREPDESGRWTYREGGSEPRPPWRRGPHPQD